MKPVPLLQSLMLPLTLVALVGQLASWGDAMVVVTPAVGTGLTDTSQLSTESTFSNASDATTATVASGDENGSSTVSPPVLASSPHCTFPGTPRHGHVIRHQHGFPHNSTVEFGCDAGYLLIGPQHIRCLAGIWARGVPFCVRDVARAKPAYLAPTDHDDESVESPTELAGLALDGDPTTCSTTIATTRPRTWGVGLFEQATVTILKIVLGAPLTDAQLEVRVGNSHPLTQPAFNRVCKTVTANFSANTEYYLLCDKPAPQGRFVSVHVQSPQSLPLVLCTLEVHSEMALAPEDACPTLNGKQSLENITVELFYGKCFEFHTSGKRVPLAKGRDICESRGGRLVGGGGLERRSLAYLAWRATKLFDNDAFWLDASSKQGAWTWADGQEVSMELGRDEEATNDSCLAAGSRGTFEPSHCDRDLRLVCQYEPLNCGTPHLPKSLRDWALVDKLKVGQTLSKLKCEEGFYPTPEDRLVCYKNGTLTGGLHCHPFACGAPPLVAGASIRLRPPESAEYACTVGLFLKGDYVIHCNASSALWSPAPLCEGFMAFMARKAGSARDTISEQFMQKYNAIPRSARLGLVAALVLCMVLGFAKCVSVRHKRIVNKI